MIDSITFLNEIKARSGKPARTLTRLYEAFAQAEGGDVVTNLRKYFPTTRDFVNVKESTFADFLYKHQSTQPPFRL